jgi:hypothetical protein
VSTPTFRIGEGALVRDNRNLPIIALPYIGTVVTIRSGLMFHPRILGLVCHEIECFDGERVFASPVLLMKLPPSDSAFAKFREQLVRKPPARAPHPTIAGVLDLLGQSPIQQAREALGL